MIKWVALLLIATNAGLWAWTHGWLSPSLQPPGESQREPQRLQQQVRPESIVVLSPRAASAALEKLAAAGASEGSTDPGEPVSANASGPVAGAVPAAPPAASAPPRVPPGRPAPR
jgi:hypothetical protein